MLKNESLSLVLLISFAFTNQVLAAGKIVKWVDSKGITHYEDKLPADRAGKRNQEMNKQGIALKSHSNKTDEDENTQLNKENLAQQRKDNILLASYTNAEEIDLARDRNLERTQATLQALNVQKENADGRTARNQVKAEGALKKNKPLPDYLKTEIKLSKAESSKLAKKISDYENNLENIKERYAAEKIRFIVLKKANSEK